MFSSADVAGRGRRERSSVWWQGMRGEKRGEEDGEERNKVARRGEEVRSGQGVCCCVSRTLFWCLGGGQPKQQTKQSLPCGTFASQKHLCCHLLSLNILQPTRTPPDAAPPPTPHTTQPRASTHTPALHTTQTKAALALTAGASGIRHAHRCISKNVGERGEKSGLKEGTGVVGDKG